MSDIPKTKEFSPLAKTDGATAVGATVIKIDPTFNEGILSFVDASVSEPGEAVLALEGFTSEDPTTYMSITFTERDTANNELKGVTITGGVDREWPSGTDIQANPTAWAWNNVRSLLLDHSTEHQNNGTDEINVAGLSGELADTQKPKAHSTSHENNGADEISIEDLAGESTALKLHKSNTVLEENLTVNIPTDYATLQDAVDELSLLRNIKPGVVITLNIESGHALTKGLKVENGDYSHFKITSVDSVVQITSGFDPAVFTAAGTRNWILVCANATAPVLDTEINGSNYTGTLYGFLIVFSSRANITEGSGISHCYYNIEVRGSSNVYARNTKWNNATQNGIRVTSACFADFAYSEANNCGTGLYVSRVSVVNAGNISIDGSAGSEHGGNPAVDIRRSRVMLEYGSITNSQGEGIRLSRVAHLYARGLTINGTGSYGIHVREGSETYIDLATFSNIGDSAFRVIHGTLRMEEMTYSNVTSHTIEYFRGSIIYTDASYDSLSPSSVNTISANGICFN